MVVRAFSPSAGEAGAGGWISEFKTSLQQDPGQRNPISKNKNEGRGNDDFEHAKKVFYRLTMPPALLL